MPVQVERVLSQIVVLVIVFCIQWGFKWVLRVCFSVYRFILSWKMEKEYLSSTNTVDALRNKFYYHPTEFENYMAMIFEALGYTDVMVTTKSNDGGKDIVMYQREDKCIAEVKLYSPEYKISREKIQKLHSAMLDSDAAHAIFVTTSDFTSAAMAYAGKHEIDLINGFLLNRLILAVQGGTTHGQADILFLKDYIHQDLEEIKKRDIKKAADRSTIILFLYLVYAVSYLITVSKLKLWYLLILMLLCMSITIVEILKILLKKT